MARQAIWTAEDCDRARQWISGKARTGVIFRDQTTAVDDNIDALASVADDDLQAVIREMLTDKAWSRLLNTLRQHRHNATSSTTATSSTATDNGGCRGCTVLKTEVGIMRDYAHQLEQSLMTAMDAIEANAVPDDIIKRLIQFCHPDRHNGCTKAVELTQWLNEYKKRRKQPSPPPPPPADPPAEPDPQPDTATASSGGAFGKADPPPPADPPPAPQSEPQPDPTWRCYAIIGHKIKGAIKTPRPPAEGVFREQFDVDGVRYIAVLTSDQRVLIVSVDEITGTLRPLIRLAEGQTVIEALALAEDQTVTASSGTRSIKLPMADYRRGLGSSGRLLPRLYQNPQTTISITGTD